MHRLGGESRHLMPDIRFKELLQPYPLASQSLSKRSQLWFALDPENDDAGMFVFASKKCLGRLVNGVTSLH